MRQTSLLTAALLSVLLLSGCNNVGSSKATNQDPPKAQPPKLSGDGAKPATPVPAGLPELASGALPDKTNVVAGTERPQVLEVKGYERAYAFQKYLVLLNPRPDEAGEIITVVLKSGPDDVSALADPTKTIVYTTIREEAGYFFGLLGDMLFLDAGTGPDARELIVYDLSSKKDIYRASYAAPISLDKDLRLTYYAALEGEVSDKECPEAAKWREQGLGVAKEEEVSLDLKSLKLARSGLTRCSQRQ